ncbi:MULTISPECIES: hypothetical protein [unclassified Erythrobacter]|uniref:hypothetical protein n=1 Tax=unclassified Erythrobacter TaxID=2633097 RepID=UPI0012ED058A|nr:MULTISPECIES: hypothetical protein [unclassified Erythrobacter]MBO6767839.1 hypothetical protein [Erythrobacter sp.]
MSAQEITREEAIAILEEAREAREQARKALDDADAALQAAERMLGQSSELAQESGLPKSGPVIASADLTASPTVSRENFCEDVSEQNTAAEMLKTGEVGDDKVEGGLNWFTASCLGLKRWRDYKDVTVLDIKATASSADGVVEAGLGFTRRWLNSSNDIGPDQLFNTSYRTIRPAVFVSTADATDAALFDLDKFQFESGIGIKLGVEFGRHSSKKRSKLVGDINAAIATARASCIAAKSVVDPLAPLEKSETEADRPSQLGLRSGENLLGECAGKELLEWLRKDAAGNWASIVKPIWGYDGKPVMYGGLEASYAWSETSYYPLRDTNTGALLGNDLPAGFLAKEGATPQDTNPFSLSAYVGGTRPFSPPIFSGSDGSIGLSGSLTYRRSFEVPKSLRDQTVCVDVTGTNFEQCRNVNIGAPYEREGFVVATALKFQMPRLAFLPETGFTIKPSYAFDIDQFGVEVPIYFLADAEGKLNGGIKFTCTEDGTTDGGFEIEGECGAALFFGSKFTIGGTP